MSEGLCLLGGSCLKFITEILGEFSTPLTFSRVTVCMENIRRADAREWRGHVSGGSGNRCEAFIARAVVWKIFSKIRKFSEKTCWSIHAASEPEDSFLSSSYNFCKSKHVKYIHNISFAHICLSLHSFARCRSEHLMTRENLLCCRPKG